MADLGPKGAFVTLASCDDKAHRVHWAALQGQLSALGTFLAAGDDPNARDSRGRSPLHWAAQHGQAASIAVLAAAGADLEARGLSCGTPLHVAAEAGEVEAVRALLHAGADVNAAEREGLHCCITPLWLAAAAGHMAVLRELIAAGAYVDAVNDKGWTPLFHAAAEGQVAVVRELILAGAACNAKDNDGWSPVHHAAMAVDDKAVAALAALEEGGVDLAARTDGHGWTPLHCAALHGQAVAIKWLLQKGLDVDARDNGGCTALHAAASQGDKLEAVNALLDAGAEVAARSQGPAAGWTPLHVAAAFGCIKVMGALVAAGADMGTMSPDGRSPIHVAALGGQVAAVLELAAADMDINALNGSGMSCLHYFALHADGKEVPEAPEQLVSLLSAGASAELLAARTGTTVDLLLSLHKHHRQAQALQSMQETYSYIPELIRMLAAAGCPLNGAGSVAGLLNLHLLPSFPVSTFSCWLAFRPTQGGLWPQPLSSGDLGVAEALLECSASQGYSIQARDFYCAACRGDKRLMRALLAAFPQCLQQLQCTIFSSGSSYRTSLSTIFVRRLRRLPVPKEDVLPEQHRSLVLHFCELADMLLAAGCPRQSICIRGKQVPDSVRRLGLAGRAVAVRVPGWAMEVLSFLPLLAAGVEWSPNNHPDFSPAFRAAVRELLTINRCCGFGAAPSPAAAEGREGGGLGCQAERAQCLQLPDDVLHYILRLAARPFPAWVPQLSGAARV